VASAGTDGVGPGSIKRWDCLTITVLDITEPESAASPIGYINFLKLCWIDSLIKMLSKYSVLYIALMKMIPQWYFQKKSPILDTSGSHVSVDHQSSI
jgi:hypothetical protein